MARKVDRSRTHSSHSIRLPIFACRCPIWTGFFGYEFARSVFDDPACFFVGRTRTSRKPFDLRQQVGKLVVTKLTVLPANPEAGVVLCDYFALHSIRGPNHHFMEKESLGFLGVHQGETSVRCQMTTSLTLSQLTDSIWKFFGEPKSIDQTQRNVARPF
jgi:hypothetical protein